MRGPILSLFSSLSGSLRGQEVRVYAERTSLGLYVVLTSYGRLNTLHLTVLRVTPRIWLTTRLLMYICRLIEQELDTTLSRE